MTYKAAIFDLDGTLADTLASIAHSANMALEQLGFPALPLDNYRYYAGDGAQELMKRALAACGGYRLFQTGGDHAGLCSDF